MRVKGSESSGPLELWAFGRAGTAGECACVCNEEDPVTDDKNFKRLVRARMAETGTSYTQARKELLTQTQPQAASSMTMPTPIFRPLVFRLWCE